MILQLLLILSIVLQLVAASVAIGLIRKTKYNSSWMLFTVALSVMAFLRLCEYLEQTGLFDLHFPPEFFVWSGIATSLCFAVGVLMVKRIFDYIYRNEEQRRMSERRILHTILRTEEKERQRFSKDLHDGLGPLLSSAKLSLSALPADKLSDHEQQILANASLVVDEAIRSLREVSVNLSPHVLKDFGLARAISNFINRLPQSSLKIAFETNLKEERFDRDVEVILYRVVGELISNSLKHAGADLVTLQLHYADDTLRIHYGDNGCGFRTAEVEGKGMGFSNISSRVASLKGGLTIEGFPGKGMEAKIEIPITQPIQ